MCAIDGESIYIYVSRNRTTMAGFQLIIGDRIEQRTRTLKHTYTTYHVVGGIVNTNSLLELPECISVYIYIAMARYGCRSSMRNACLSNKRGELVECGDIFWCATYIYISVVCLLPAIVCVSVYIYMCLLYTHSLSIEPHKHNPTHYRASTTRTLPQFQQYMIRERGKRISGTQANWYFIVIESTHLAGSAQSPLHTRSNATARPASSSSFVFVVVVVVVDSFHLRVVLPLPSIMYI